jgi:hypothetical protein
VKVRKPIEPYTLLEPVKVTYKGPNGEREETITEVKLRRPKGKDLRIMDRHEGNIAKGMAMVARLSGLDDHVIDELDGEDLMVLLDRVAGFLPDGPATGGTSSET